MSSTDTGLTVKESTIEEEADRILNKVSTLTDTYSNKGNITTILVKAY